MQNESRNDSRNMVDVKPRIAESQPVDKSRNWKALEVNEASQCRSMRLPDSLTAMRVPICLKHYLILYAVFLLSQHFISCAYITSIVSVVYFELQA